MIRDMLFKLEREAEQRVHEARDREIDRGGPGSARRASEAMDAPMLEVAAIRKVRQRLGDLQMEIDHQSNLLRRTGRNLDLPSDVKRFRAGEAETKLAKLGADYKALEAEAEQRFFPTSKRSGDSQIYYRDGVWLLARPEPEPNDPVRPGLPVMPRPKPKPPAEFPLPQPRPQSVRLPEDIDTEFPSAYSEPEIDPPAADSDIFGFETATETPSAAREQDGENRPDPAKPSADVAPSAGGGKEWDIDAIKWQKKEGLVDRNKSEAKIKTTDPVRIDLNGYTIGIDGLRYTVDWHPLDKDGNRETVVQRPDYKAPEYGGLVLPGIPSQTIIKPPYPHPYGFEVTVKVPPQARYNDNSAGPYLDIYVAD